jgi:hypothetical protein
VTEDANLLGYCTILIGQLFFEVLEAASLPEM